MAAKSLLFYIPMGLVLMMFVVWKLMEMVIYTMMVTYDLKFKDLLRNSFLLTIGKLPLAVGVKLLTLVVPILAIAAIFIIPGAEPYVMLIFAVLYLLFMPAFNRLILGSFSNALCEKYINPKIEGAQSNIGLRPENWDDTEYIPEDDEE